MQRVIVSGFVFKNGKCLLIQRGLSERFLPGYWENPGGKLDFGEDPMEGVLREIKEEVGIDAKIVGIHRVWHWTGNYDKTETHFVQIAFVLEPLTDKIVLEDKLNNYRWVTLEEARALEMSPEMRKEIESGFEWIRNHE